MRRLMAGLFATAGLLGLASAAEANVLRVGTFNGSSGPYTSIQDAVDAAHPGDWILVGPGDYKEHTGRAPVGHADTPAGVLITTPGVHLRGMDRDGVVVDGTKPDTPTCSSRQGDQELGPAGLHSGDAPLGLNGVMVFKANNVSVENLTTCNFLHGSGNTGNEIWWNGGDGSGTVGGFGFLGTYLNATSSFFGSEQLAAQYGIFSSNWSGGLWDHTYASNFNDSGYYIGACQQVCNQTLAESHGQYNALGYSGSNSGGKLVITHSEFDNNEDGFDTNSQNGDNPPPQNGACPNNGISPITHTHSCWVFMNNFVHDNNNPNVPSAGSAAAGPVGTGMSVSGGRNDTIMDNRFERNNAWGVIFVPYPDSGPPCTGGVLTPVLCLYDDSGNALLNNTFGHNGSYGNPTNGDFAELTSLPGASNCFRGNTEEGGGSVSSSPAGLQTLKPACGGLTLPDPNPIFLDQALCDSESISFGPIPGGAVCLPGTHYPRRTEIVMHPLPTDLATMPNPCQGVPANPWCPGLSLDRQRIIR
jgi:hypothetical protein